MKKALLVGFALLLTPFSVSGMTIYSQLTDSSGNFRAEDETIVVATFTTPATVRQMYDLASNTKGLLGAFVTNQSGSAQDYLFALASSSAQCVRDSYFISTGSVNMPDGTTELIEADFEGGASVFLMPNTEYYVCFRAVDPTSDFLVSANLSVNFFYGYIQDVTSGNIPVVPGIAGFTDVGISTTSQQIWCNQNFSTSSGLLDNLGQSISLGVCNVGVFLFVPSSNALGQFSQLASTSQTKIPFSYISGVSAIFAGLSASSTANLTAVTINFPDISSTSPLGSIIPSTIVGLSTTTIGTYLPNNVRLAFLALQSTFLWAGFIFMMYRRIIPHKVL